MSLLGGLLQEKKWRQLLLYAVSGHTHTHTHKRTPISSSLMRLFSRTRDYFRQYVASCTKRLVCCHCGTFCTFYRSFIIISFIKHVQTEKNSSFLTDRLVCIGDFGRYQSISIFTCQQCKCSFTHLPIKKRITIIPASVSLVTAILCAAGFSKQTVPF